MNINNFWSKTPHNSPSKITLQHNKNSEYLELVYKTNKAFETAEPIILHQNSDQDQDNSLSFEGAETYKNDDVFLDHFTNLAVG